MVDVQALLQGGTAAAQEAMGPILDGIMFSRNQGGVSTHAAPSGPLGEGFNPSQHAQHAAADGSQAGGRWAPAKPHWSVPIQSTVTSAALQTFLRCNAMTCQARACMTKHDWNGCVMGSVCNGHGIIQSSVVPCWVLCMCI